MRNHNQRLAEFTGMLLNCEFRYGFEELLQIEDKCHVRIRMGFRIMNIAN